MEKTKNGYDLKVARIVSISSVENTVCSVEELHILLISISVGSQQRTFFIVYMSLRCPIKQRNRLHRVCVQAVSPFLFFTACGFYTIPIHIVRSINVMSFF